MKDNTVIGIFIAAIAVVFALSVWWTVSVYEECRETKSVSYCLRVISK